MKIKKYLPMLIFIIVVYFPLVALTVSECKRQNKAYFEEHSIIYQESEEIEK